MGPWIIRELLRTERREKQEGVKTNAKEKGRGQSCTTIENRFGEALLAKN